MSDSSFLLRTFGAIDLLSPNGVRPRAVLSQPKRLALFLYLAAASPRGFQRKDTLLALFWPESPAGRARRALNRAVYYLRRSLDPGVLVSRGDEELALAEGRVWCDAVEFERALEAGLPERALELYRGDFAVGFFVDGLSEFERWVESERRRLRDRALEAALDLATRDEARGELLLAAQWAQRAAALAPHDERPVQQRIVLLDRAGDRAGALQVYQEFADRLRDDLGVEPSPETQALEAAARNRCLSTHESAVPAVDAAPSARRREVRELAAAPAAPHPRARWLPWGLVAGLLAGALTLATVPRGQRALTLGRRAAVAAAPEWERWPVLSPDGSMVYYVSSSPAGAEIFARQLDGGTPVPLTAPLTGSQDYPALSPDGKRLLFLADDGLYTMPALGGRPLRVVSGSIRGKLRLFWGSWAPDGRRIVYTNRDTLFTEIIDEDRRVALATGAGLHSPAWSPDGKWIAFVEGNPLFHVIGNTAFSAIRVVPASGGRTVSVTGASAFNTSPVWVPGLQALLFISDREGGRDIYQVALDRDGAPRSAPIRLTTGLNAERLSLSHAGRRLAWSVFTEISNIWSLTTMSRDSLPLSGARQHTRQTQRVEGVFVAPDRIWLYYGSDRSGNSDLWRVPLAGGEAEQLTADPAGDFAPAVSPDGSEVAFQSQRNGNRDIFIMPAGGGAEVQVSSGPGEENVPVWSPDGQALIWVDGDTIRIARRRPDRSWGTPAALLSAPDVGPPQWSPDGRWISFSRDHDVVSRAGGFELFDPVTGARRSLPGASGVFWHAWSGDSRTIFGAMGGSAPTRIIAVPVNGERPRVVGNADQPLSQEFGLGLAISGERLYFPLLERQADVWVGEVRLR